QFDTLQLGNTGFQIHVLDALASNGRFLNEYRSAFAEWQQAKKMLEQLKAQQVQSEKESDYNQFQYDELAAADFKENELEDIDESLKLLTHSEGIKAALAKAYNTLEEGEQPLVQQLKSMINGLHSYSNYHKQLPELVDRLSAAQVELQDV